MYVQKVKLLICKVPEFWTSPKFECNSWWLIASFVKPSKRGYRTVGICIYWCVGMARAVGSQCIDVVTVYVRGWCPTWCHFCAHFHFFWKSHYHLKTQYQFEDGMWPPEFAGGQWFKKGFHEWFWPTHCLLVEVQTILTIWYPISNSF